MMRVAAMVAFMVVVFPMVVFAGFGDLLNAAEEVNSLIPKKEEPPPAPAPEQAEPSKDSTTPAPQGRDDAAAKSVTDTMSRKKARIDETKVNCDKADEITDADQAEYDKNPLGAIFNKADKMCTYVQRVYQKAKPAKTLPQKSAFTEVSTDHVVAVATAFWAGSNDAEFVKVLGGRIIGSGWKDLYHSDVKGVPSARQLGVAHSISYKDACYVVYGHLYQTNGNHPNPLLPPSWSGSEYKASDYEQPEKIDCNLAKTLK
jgi:hypothetical protein